MSAVRLFLFVNFIKNTEIRNKEIYFLFLYFYKTNDAIY